MNDTSRLLRETCQGCKYSTESLGIAIGYAKDDGLKRTLSKYDKEQEALKERISAVIKSRGEKEIKHPEIGATMTKMHMNVSLTLNPSTSRIAELIIDGCSMGIKSVSRYKNRNKNASAESTELANELINCCDRLRSELLGYLV